MRIYADQASRLLRDFVQPGNVAGFVVTHLESEDIYAVTHSGAVFRRTAKRDADFNRPNAKWGRCELPAEAEWIGQYRMPRQLRTQEGAA